MNHSATLLYRLRNRRRQGFTLIEILVASAVMALLVGLVITITSQVLNVWNRSGGRLASNQEARIALELLTQDLETAIFRNNGLQWFLLRNDDFSGPGGTFTNTVLIRLFTPAVDRPEGPGDICGVSYALDYLNPVTGGTSGDRQFVLYRRVNTPLSTFNNLMGGAVQESLESPIIAPSSSTTATWQVDTQEDYLVANIVEFRVDIYAEDPLSPSGISTTPITLARFGGPNATVGPGLDGSGDPLPSRPVYADIKLRVLSSEGANILQGRGSAVDLDDLIREHATTYIRRVSFMNRPF
jgi:prepilin-type N-terminal cleavage/methylation domain-containing protein